MHDLFILKGLLDRAAAALALTPDEATAPAAAPQVSDDAARLLSLGADDSDTATCDLCGDRVSVDDVITDCHQRTVCHSCADDLGII
jgi:hypothetical protein